MYARLIAAAVAAAAVIGVAVALVNYGEKTGRAEVQARWDKSLSDARDAAASDTRFGQQSAHKLNSALLELEKRYAATNVQLQLALRRKVVCPASGEIGDVVVPADTVRSMFNVDDSVRPPGPAASGPAASVHTRP